MLLVSGAARRIVLAPRPPHSPCNGNGNGLFYSVWWWQLGYGECGIWHRHYWCSGSFEDSLFWQHLANAGFIEGLYSGATPFAGSATGHHVWRAMLPTSKISATRYTVGYVGGSMS